MNSGTATLGDSHRVIMLCAQLCTRMQPQAGLACGVQTSLAVHMTQTQGAEIAGWYLQRC